MQRSPMRPLHARSVAWQRQTVHFGRGGCRNLVCIHGRRGSREFACRGVGDEEVKAFMLGLFGCWVLGV